MGWSIVAVILLAFSTNHLTLLRLSPNDEDGYNNNYEHPQVQLQDDDSASIGSRSRSNNMSQNAHGVCRIEVAKVEWDPLQPWQRSQQSRSTGTGFVIEGERLLTNAHVVKSAIDIRVRPHGSTRRFPARVVCYGPDVDLALLEIIGESEHADFFGHQQRTVTTADTSREEGRGDPTIVKRPRASMALEFATDLPSLQESVHVVGFPTGGRTICVTEGVVSRIDLMDRIVCIQVDSAINPGSSGGPAFNSKGQVTGVAFRKKVATKTQKVDNIGYLIPAIIVQTFLGRVDPKRGTYALSASIPYRCHTLENHSLRLAHQVPDSVHGVLITSVAETVLGDDSLRKGDILTKVDDSDVADDGQVVLRGDELIQHAYLMRIKKYNEPVVFTVYRDGGYVQCPPCVLRDIQPILPRWEDVDWMPNYMILGSVVVLPFVLAMKYAKQCGSLLKADGIEHYMKWPNEWEGKEGLVVLTEIFAHELSFSYGRPWRRVVSYNGVPILSLKHLQEMWEASCAEVAAQDIDASTATGTIITADDGNGGSDGVRHRVPTFARLELENDDDVVFEVRAAIKAQAEVMATHAISKQCNIIPPNPKYV